MIAHISIYSKKSTIPSVDRMIMGVQLSTGQGTGSVTSKDLSGVGAHPCRHVLYRRFHAPYSCSCVSVLLCGAPRTCAPVPLPTRTVGKGKGMKGRKLHELQEEYRVNDFCLICSKGFQYPYGRWYTDSSRLQSGTCSMACEKEKRNATLLRDAAEESTSSEHELPVVL